MMLYIYIFQGSNILHAIHIHSILLIEANFLFYLVPHSSVSATLNVHTKCPGFLFCLGF